MTAPGDAQAGQPALDDEYRPIRPPASYSDLGLPLDEDGHPIPADPGPLCATCGHSAGQHSGRRGRCTDGAMLRTAEWRCDCTGYVPPGGPDWCPACEVRVRVDDCRPDTLTDRMVCVTCWTPLTPGPVLTTPAETPGDAQAGGWDELAEAVRYFRTYPDAIDEVPHIVFGDAYGHAATIVRAALAGPGREPSCRALVHPDLWSFPLTSLDDITCGATPAGACGNESSHAPDEIERSALAGTRPDGELPRGDHRSAFDHEVERVALALWRLHTPYVLARPTPLDDALDRLIPAVRGLAQAQPAGDALASRPAVPQADEPPKYVEVSPGLCSECGRWRDRTGHLTGWDAADESGRFWPLPLGHMPPDYHIDASTGWIPRYRPCPHSPWERS